MLAYSAVLAFLFLRSLDEESVLGQTAVVWVSDTDGSSNGIQVVDSVRKFAAEHRTTVAREVPDLRRPYSVRHLYMATGGPHSDWLSDGYPAFSRGKHTDIHPISDLGRRDPRGFYFVFGADRDATDLAAVFDDLGLRASVKHPLTLAGLSLVYKGGALYRSFFVVALAAVATTGAGVLLNTRAYGVLRLQGMSLGDIMMRDLRQLARFWAIALTAITSFALAALGIYNGLAWFGWYTLIALIFATLLSIVVLGTHAAMLWLTSQTQILGALKGELPARAASLCTYAVRVPALLLTLSVATAVVISGQNLLDRQESARAYSQIGRTTSITLNGSLASEDALDQMKRKVGNWLREEDRAGHVIVVGHRGLQKSAPRDHMPSGDILIVNNSFLAHQPMYSATGDHIHVTNGHDQIRLLIPERLAGYTERLRALVPGLLNPGHPETVDPMRISTLPTQDHQSVFTYNPRGQSHVDPKPGVDDSFVTDPVIIAFPDGSPYLSTASYTAYASQSSIVFNDPNDVEAGIERHHLETFVTGMVPVAQNAALKLRRIVDEFRLQLFNLAVSVSVLLITGIGVCIVYSRKKSQTIFVRYVSGWTFCATHRSLLVTVLDCL